MKATIQKLSQAQLELKIEIPTSEFQTFIDKAVLSLGKEVEIEGFRKGHAPKEAVEKKVGQTRILQEAAQECIKENYLKAVLENKIEPLGQPEIAILKLAPGNPFEFKAKVSTLPEVKLPDYQKIASQAKKQKVEVAEEEIAKLKAEKERIEKERLRNEILGKIAQQSELEVPEILVDSERKRMLETLKQQVPQMLQIKFEDYLKKINKSEKELLDSFSSEAEKRVKNSLVLRAIEKKENIGVSEKELEAEMAKLSQIYPNFDQNQLKEYTKGVIKNEKIFQLLESLIK
jgi:FKBP-type peptidyl-prolyl cis-trans isomerase (trigger factor)